MKEISFKKNLLKKLKSKKVIIISLMIIVVISLYYRHTIIQQKNIPIVKTVPVRYGDIITSLSVEGVIVPGEKAIIQAKVTRTIEEILIQDGELVNKGDILIKLDQSYDKLQLHQAQAQLAHAKANKSQLYNGDVARAREQARINLKEAQIALNEAKRNYDDAKFLYQVEAISKHQFELAQLQLNKAKIAYESAQKQVAISQNLVTQFEVQAANEQIKQAAENLKEAEKSFQETIITAPIAGKVIFEHPELLQKDIIIQAGTHLMTIIDTDKLQVKAYIEEENINAIKIGQPVKITGPSLPFPLTGKISKISSEAQVEKYFTQIPIYISLEGNIPELKVGTSVDVEIITNYKTNTLIVPQNTIQHLNGEPIAYVIEKHSPPVAYQRILRTGLQNEYSVEILSGLKENEKVAIITNTNLQHGMRVKLEGE